MAAGKPQGAVEKAVRSELRKLGFSLAVDGSAALAVSLARQIDRTPGAQAAAAAAGEMRLLLADLRRDAASRSTERDPIDDLAADELAERRAGRSGAAS